MKRKSRPKKLLYLLVSICLLAATAYTTSYINRLERRIRDLEEKNNALKKTIERLRAENKRLSLIEKCRLIEKKVEQIRGLKAKELVDFDVITKKELRSILDQKFEETYPDVNFDSMETAFKILGLIEPDLDLKGTIMRVYDEQVAAFYDYENKKMYMVDSNMFTSTIRDMFLAHELTHMLEDQHYDLIKMGIDDMSNDDRSLALSSLLEGDATRLMNTYYLKNAGLHIFVDVVAGVYMELKQSEIDKAPAFIKDTLIFPYMKGLIFVMALYEMNDNNAVHKAFLDPPVSTEQILHPEKYFGQRDDPVTPDLPDLDALYETNGLTELYRNTLGEFAMGIWLKNYIPADKARNASEGWDGDRYVVFQNRDKPDCCGYIFKSNWDTKQDTVSFVNAYQLLLERKYSVDLDDPQDASDIQYELPNGCRVSIHQQDTGVTIIYASEEIFDDVLSNVIVR